MAIKIDWVKEDVAPYRRKTMSKIRAQNTKPEIALRRGMWNMGIRYRIHSKDLPGRPDIFIKKIQTGYFY